MKIKVQSLCLFLLLLQLVECFGLWWYAFRTRAVKRPLIFDERRICRRAKRLKGLQAGMCRKQRGLVREVVRGARHGVKECEYQLRHHRWNCTNARRSIGKILLRDTRETAFVQAITAAAAGYQVTELCNNGSHIECQCLGDDTPQHQHKYKDRIYFEQGCMNPLDFGLRKSAEFMDAEDGRYQDIRAKILHHNNQVGRELIRANIVVKCKCHGLSGSCQLKTCFKKLPRFRTAAHSLYRKFNEAERVSPGNDGRSIYWASAESGMENGGIYRRSLPDAQLIYTDPSPDFCQRALRQGVLGPKGRPCFPNYPPDSEGSCEHLCCGRGHQVTTESNKVNCNCKFHWCCDVTCDVCVTNITYAWCK